MSFWTKIGIPKGFWAGVGRWIKKHWKEVFTYVVLVAPDSKKKEPKKEKTDK